MKTLNVWLGAGTLFLLSGCLSEIPTKELDGSASNPVAASQRQSLGLGNIATYNTTNLPALTATSFSGSLTGNADTATLAGNVTGTVAVANGGTGATTAAGALTNLGANTIGSNLFTLANPDAVTFPRFNVDNTVSALDAATFRGAIGAGTGSGTVTSVAGAGTVSGLTLTGTVTNTGNLTLGGTLSVANSATTATSANTPSAIVARDASGNFSAGAISATGLSVSGFLNTTCASVTVDGSNTIVGDVAGEQASCLVIGGIGAQTFTLSNGTASGTRLTLIAAPGATTSLNLANAAAAPGPFLASATAWTPSENDTLELLWTGTQWVELARSNN